MKKIFAQVSYTFSNFYNNLSSQGQIIFTIIVGLIILLFLILLITSVIQKINSKKEIERYINKSSSEEKKEVINTDINNDDKVNEVENIAKRIEEALSDDTPVTLTSFEEDQERTAIISIDELMKKAKELELIDDEPTGVNYLEKYNLEPSLVEEVTNKTINNNKQEVKAFKVSQVISPIYGIKKDIDNDK